MAEPVRGDPAGPARYPSVPVGPEQLQALVDHTSAVIYMRDMDGRYLVVNREYERLFHLRGRTSSG